MDRAEAKSMVTCNEESWLGESQWGSGVVVSPGLSFGLAAAYGAMGYRNGNT